MALCLLAAACGGDDDDTGEAAPETGTDAEAGAFAAEHYTTDLSEDCPDPVIVQKDWLAEAEHAAMYQLIGGGGTMEQNAYRGPLGSTGVDLEILDGGPGLGDGITTSSSLYAGNLVQGKEPMLAYVGTDEGTVYQVNHVNNRGGGISCHVERKVTRDCTACHYGPPWSCNG